MQCINPDPVFGSAYTLEARNALQLDPDFLMWPWGFSSPDSPNLITLDVNSFTKFEVEWNLTGNTFENTTGGIRRANQNQVLLTGGVPIKRKVYDFTATTPTALNNTPAFSLDVYEEKDVVVRVEQQTLIIHAQQNLLQAFNPEQIKLDQYLLIHLNMEL